MAIEGSSSFGRRARWREFSIARNEPTYSFVRRNSNASTMNVFGRRMYENMADREQALVNSPEPRVYCINLDILEFR